MRKTILLSCIIALIQFNASGQVVQNCDPNRFEDEQLDKLVGQWDLTGKIGTRTVQNHCSAQWILNHQFIELNLSGTGSRPGYIAKVSIGYDCISERYVAHWLDNLGGRSSETLGYGIKKNQMIEFRFEYPDGPFMNRFIYDDKNDSWQLHMTTKNAKGEWILFGDEFLKRKKQT